MSASGRYFLYAQMGEFDQFLQPSKGGPWSCHQGRLKEIIQGKPMKKIIVVDTREMLTSQKWILNMGITTAATAEHLLIGLLLASSWRGGPPFLIGVPHYMQHLKQTKNREGQSMYIWFVYVLSPSRMKRLHTISAVGTCFKINRQTNGVFIHSSKTLEAIT